jgi:Ni,Fe-hydrogenase III small subunit
MLNYVSLAPQAAPRSGMLCAGWSRIEWTAVPKHKVSIKVEAAKVLTKIFHTDYWCTCVGSTVSGEGKILPLYVPAAPQLPAKINLSIKEIFHH